MRKSVRLAASAIVLTLGVSSARAALISSTTTYTTGASLGDRLGYGQTIGTAGYWILDGGNASSANASYYPAGGFVTSIMPEPSALSLLGVGAVSLLARRRRKTASAPEQHRIMRCSHGIQR